MLVGSAGFVGSAFLVALAGLEVAAGFMAVVFLAAAGAVTFLTAAGVTGLLTDLGADTGGGLITLAAAGVGTVLHCHLPSAKIQAWPEAAWPYSWLSTTRLPAASSSPTLPPLLDKTSLVSSTFRASKVSGASRLPAGKV